MVRSIFYLSNSITMQSRDINLFSHIFYGPCVLINISCCHISNIYDTTLSEIIFIIL